MSNLSDIGFPVKSEHDVNKVIMDILPHLDPIPCGELGFYFKFEDESGAQIYLQTNPAQEIIGFNPAFAAESRREVEFTSAVERDTSDLDGAVRCWANPDPSPEPGYPFVFDAPDFKVHNELKYPSNGIVSLTAFASNDLEIYSDIAGFRAASDGDGELAARSFIPSGLFTFSAEGEAVEQESPQAHAILTGEITEWQRRRNGFTEEEFYYFVVETFGGFVDVVADPALVKDEPKIGGIVKGSFWISGKII